MGQNTTNTNNIKTTKIKKRTSSILDIVIKQTEKKKPGSGYKVNIE